MNEFNKYIIYLIIIIIFLCSHTKTASAFPGEELKLDPGNYFTPEQINLAENYKLPAYWIWGGKNLLLIIFLSLFVFTSLGPSLENFLNKIIGNKKFLIVPLYGLSLMGLWMIISFPLNFYREFLYEHKYSLTEQSFTDWLYQYLLGEMLSLIIFVFLVSGFYLIIKKSPSYWWILSGAAFAIFLISGTYLMPLIIMPLFNKFTPLTEGELRNITMETGKKAGIEIEEIYVMDASRQTKKGNAYFIGLGNSTRIVLYDTLKDNYPLEETVAVIAHEAGHWKHNHIIKGIIMGILAGFMFLLLIYILLTKYGYLFSLNSPSDIKGLAVILLLFLLINILSLPLQNIISRHFESQSDMTALELTEDPKACIALEKRLALQNLSEITPNKTLVWFLYSHPPVMERIAMAEWYKLEKEKGGK